MPAGFLSDIFVSGTCFTFEPDMCAMGSVAYDHILLGLTAVTYFIIGAILGLVLFKFRKN